MVSSHKKVTKRLTNGVHEMGLLKNLTKNLCTRKPAKAQKQCGQKQWETTKKAVAFFKATAQRLV
jgi:hypothetical protein